MLGAATVALMATALGGSYGNLGLLLPLGAVATMGAGMVGMGALRLPGWARLRRRQMEQVAARIAVVASSQPTQGRISEG
jgi:hypothetical protein